MDIGYNSNLDALTALFNLQNVNSQINTSVQRLSTGLRINSPADDPAGFQIANSLQTQVDGLNQALANTQQSTSLVKTATGALGQISTLLNSIRSNALDAAANVVTNPIQAQADQANIQSALQSLNSIAATTSFGTKNLLDGSAGVSATVTNTSLVSGASFGSSFGGGVTQAGNVTITVNNAATFAQAVGGAAATYASLNATLATVNGGTTGVGGTVTINGQGLIVTGSDTVQSLLDKINALSNSTGVSAQSVTGNGSTSITLVQQNYGANYKIAESETSPLVLGTAGANTAGLNATVTVTALTSVGGTISASTQTFVGGRYSTDSGLRATDIYGDSILLTQAGNTTGTSSAGVAAVTSNPLTFQIGANVGQTASLALPNVSASALGTTSVPGQNLSTINVTSLTGANNAVQIANEAINQVSQYAAQLGGFQTNVLQSSTNVMNVAVQNLTAAISGIEGADIGQESTNLKNLQTIQQAGISALYIAQNEPSLYLKLLP